MTEQGPGETKCLGYKVREDQKTSEGMARLPKALPVCQEKETSHDRQDTESTPRV